MVGWDRPNPSAAEAFSLPISAAFHYLPPVSAATPTPTATATSAERVRPGYRTLFGDLASLTKPSITRLVVMTAAAGYVLAVGFAGDVWTLVHTLIGSGLAASGASALNMWWERKSDAAMRRTSGRALPAGRVSPRAALTFALSLSALGLLDLVLFVNLPTTALVAASLLSYVLVYTPLKRRTHHSTLIGAVPGALPTLAGWTATGEPVGAAALGLFGVVFLWQMPHFYALAHVYRDDYDRGGLRMLSVIDPAGARVARQSVFYSALLLVVSVVPTTAGLLGWFYGGGAIVLGAAMVVLSIRFWMERDNQRAWQLFFGSIIYLPVLLVLMMVDRFLV